MIEMFFLIQSLPSLSSSLNPQGQAKSVTSDTLELAVGTVLSLPKWHCSKKTS